MMTDMRKMKKQNVIRNHLLQTLYAMSEQDGTLY